MKICKFGGSSLADAKQIRKVCDIVLSDNERRIVVVSAPGKRYSDDIKVTDLLISLANAIISGYDGKKEKTSIIERYASIATDLGIDDNFAKTVENDLDSRIKKNKDNTRDLTDALKAAGEDLCARLVATYLKSIGEVASYVSPADAGLILSTESGNVVVHPDSYRRINEHFAKIKGTIIFPGFFGLRSDGRVITFSRGGSDITGAILANATDASVYENWTDVDNVYCVNPNLVERPQAISEISYSEMRELAYAGFTVLHEEALAPTAAKSIPVNIRNTNNPHAHGTSIVFKRKNYESVVTGIAGSKGFTILHMSKYLMNREVGFALKVLQILADFSIPFEHMPSGIDSLSLVLRNEVFPPEKERLVIKRLKDELQLENIHIERNIAIVMIVGDAMAQTVGVTAKATSALSRAGVNLELIIQGASEISVIFGIKESFCNYAIKELYREFFLR